MKARFAKPRMPAQERWAGSGAVSSSAGETRRTGAFTLTEIMVTMAIFALVAVGLLGLQIFGMRMSYISANQLISTAGSLKALDQIRNQVLESSNNVQVGNYSNSVFTSTMGSADPSGNALMISNGPSSYSLFYLDASTNTFYELTGSAVGNQLTALAHSVTNQQVFQVQNYLGDPLTNNAQNYTIQMTLQFPQLDYTVPNGTNVYNYYQLQTRMTPRNQFWATQ